MTALRLLASSISHCRFCQQLTGFAYLVEPIFRKANVVFEGIAVRHTRVAPTRATKRVTLNFCGRSGTNLYLDLERFPDVLGLCGGTFDDFDWFDQCIAVTSSSARPMLPGRAPYEGHAINLDGPNQPIVLAHALTSPKMRRVDLAARMRGRWRTGT